MNLIRLRIATAAFVLGLVFVAGTVGYYLLGGGRWTLSECAYFVLITLAAVGYGETLDVRSVPGGMALTMVLIVSGIGVLVYFVSNFTAFVVEGELQHMLRRRRMNRKIGRLKDHIILCGAGRMGQAVIRELVATGDPFVVIDHDPHTLELLETEFGGRITYVEGNAADDATLLEAHIGKATGLIAALADDHANLYVTISAKSLNRDIRVVAKAVDPKAEDKLRLAGAERVVQVNTIGGLRLASEMIRPEVTSFLDHMMRDPDRVLRVEEIPVHTGSSFVGKRLADSEIRRASDVLVIAVRMPGGRYIYNPGPDTTLPDDCTLIVIGNPQQVRSLRAL